MVVAVCTRLIWEFNLPTITLGGVLARSSGHGCDDLRVWSHLERAGSRRSRPRTGGIIEINRPDIGHGLWFNGDLAPICSVEPQAGGVHRKKKHPCYDLFTANWRRRLAMTAWNNGFGLLTSTIIWPPLGGPPQGIKHGRAASQHHPI